MKGGPLYCVLLLAIAVHADHHGDHIEHHGHDEGAHIEHASADSSGHFETFNKLDDRIDKLVTRLQNVKDRVSRRTDPGIIAKARSLRSRVQKVEGSGCDDKHFQCGGSDPECQSFLFVCDGHKDCRNGADEQFCEMPTKQGDYFEGHVIWDTCTQRKPDILAFEITSVRTSTFFTPASLVRANILIDHENPRFDGHASLPAIGAYHLGRRVLAFRPPESDRLALFCKFDGYNMDRCEGFIAHEASLDICAELVFVRK